MATLLGAAVLRARRASNLLFSQLFDLKAARRDPHEGRRVNRLARNLALCAGVFIALGIGGAERADAQPVSDWGNETCLECHSEPGLSMELPSGETLDVTIDADRWHDVNERLPLLSQEKWYRQTRYGYARGYEARQYVENIRSYHDTLVWMETRAHPMLVVMAD